MSRTNEIILIITGLSIMLAILFAMPAYAAGDVNDGGNYVGPKACKFCHIEYYNTWIKTNHSRAFERLVERGETTNASCLPCHTTGWDAGTKTYKFKDVTCEVCHGSGDISNKIAQNVIDIISSREDISQENISQENVSVDNVSRENLSPEDKLTILSRMNLTKKSMVRNLTAELCGRCHQGKHRPTYEEWNKSKHAQSLIDLKKNKGAKDECLECHSSEYITAEERNKPTLNTATMGITCQACHSPHITKNTKLLRMPKQYLCESCHYGEELKPGKAPHHTQKEMRRSFGGIDSDTYIYQPNAACADCHRFTSKYNQTGNNEEGITGHTFKIDFRVCLTCHEGFPDAVKAEEFVRKQQETIMGHYNDSIIKVNDAGNLTKAISGDERTVYDRVYNQSLFNIQFVAADKSKGAHNPKYAEELIHKAEVKADNILRGKPEATMYLPGFGFLPGIMALLLGALIFAMKYRK